MKVLMKGLLVLVVLMVACTIASQIAIFNPTVNTLSHQCFNDANQAEVPIWTVGDFWTYDIAIAYEQSSTVVDVVLRDTQFTVTGDTPTNYTLTFIGSVTGSAVIAGIVEGTLQNTVIEGSATIRKDDLAISSISDVYINGEIQRQFVTNDFSAELSIQQNVTPLVSPYDFPLVLEETWSIPRVSLWLYVSAEIDLAIPYQLTYNFPVYIDERSATCVAIETISVDAGNYNDAFHLILENSGNELWYSPSARNVLVASYTDVRMLYNESLYWTINNLDVILLETSYPPINNPPDIPYEPVPANNSENVSTAVILQWTSTDPDGDAVAYDLYFGIEPNPPLIMSGLSDSLHVLTALMSNTTYHWRVIAHDDHDHSVMGPLWTFRTVATGNRPPNQPERPSGPSSGTTNTAYEYISAAEDIDGDSLHLRFDWGDGTTSEWMGPYPSGEQVSASHTWQNVGSYSITAQARDEHGLESDWSDPLPVSMPLWFTQHIVATQSVSRK